VLLQDNDYLHLSKHLNGPGLFSKPSQSRRHLPPRRPHSWPSRWSGQAVAPSQHGSYSHQQKTTSTGCHGLTDRREASRAASRQRLPPPLQAPQWPRTFFETQPKPTPFTTAQTTQLALPLVGASCGTLTTWVVFVIPPKN